MEYSELVFKFIGSVVFSLTFAHPVLRCFAADIQCNEKVDFLVLIDRTNNIYKQFRPKFGIGPCFRFFCYDLPKFGRSNLSIF